MLHLLLLLIILLVTNASTSAFSVHQHFHLSLLQKKTTTASLYALPDESLEDQERRMALVRKLQDAFYGDIDYEVEGVKYIEELGVLENVPLWRVQWTELPGRSNLLHVHEGLYTNMFESILRGPKPWYVGHMYLPGGSKNIQSNEERFQLHDWKTEVEYMKNCVDAIDNERSAPVGTLLKIVDYRRMVDGKLLLLVQGLERFVVTKVTQTRPHSIADIQILPDLEETSVLINDKNITVLDLEEEDACKVRAESVSMAFRYHKDEYLDQKLALPEKINIQDVAASSQVTSVLPIVPYIGDVEGKQVQVHDLVSYVHESCTGCSMEEKLRQTGLMTYKTPAHPEIVDATENFDDCTEELLQLEEKLWVKVDNFLLLNQRRVPQALTDFRDKKPARSRNLNTFNHLRRLRHSSYAASILLSSDTTLRQYLLQIGSCKERVKALICHLDIATAQSLKDL